MKLKNALEDKKMDVRLVDRFLSEGKLAKTDLDSHLKGLEDCEGKYERLDGTEDLKTEATE